MIQCSKCGFINKYSGMCKQCSTVNVPPISMRKRISEMNVRQKVLGSIIAVFHTIWLISTIANVCIYAISIILACLLAPDEYAALVEKTSALAVELPETIYNAPVLIIIMTSIIVLCALALAVFLYICSLIAITRYGRAMTILQAFWLFTVVFSIYAIGAINYELFVAAFFLGIAVSLLLVLYRKYEFSDK